jgi:hypothetical protein
MTIDEALLYLERDDASIRFFSPQDYEAFVTLKKYAKSQQQPCEDECVTKVEVINTIHKTIYGFFDIADDDSEEPINDKDKLLLTINKTISNAVKALPSVTPQRSRGKWIHWTDDYKDYVTCSCCEYGEEGEVLLSDKTPFCPICGADMRESENKE